MLPLVLNRRIKFPILFSHAFETGPGRKKLPPHDFLSVVILWELEGVLLEESWPIWFLGVLNNVLESRYYSQTNVGRLLPAVTYYCTVRGRANYQKKKRSRVMIRCWITIKQIPNKRIRRKQGVIPYSYVHSITFCKFSISSCRE